MRRKTIQGWYEEAIKDHKVFNTVKESFVIYRGFRISKDIDNQFEIKDVRLDDNYTNITRSSHSQLRSRGFTEGCDYVSVGRARIGVAKLRNTIERMYAKRKKFKSLIRKDKRLNEKRIKNINKNVGILVDQIFLYNTRINQFNLKYNV